MLSYAPMSSSRSPIEPSEISSRASLTSTITTAPYQNDQKSPCIPILVYKGYDPQDLGGHQVESGAMENQVEIGVIDSNEQDKSDEDAAGQQAGEPPPKRPRLDE